MESEDLHHSIDIKEEILEAQVVDEKETERYEEDSSETTSHSESTSSGKTQKVINSLCTVKTLDVITGTGFVHRKRKIKIDDPANRYYEYKLLKLYQRIKDQRSLFDIRKEIHQKTIERLKLDLQHQNEIFKLNEKLQKTVNKINEIKRLRK